MIAGSSQFSEDFPTTPGAYDPTPDPYFTEAWAARLRADGSAVEWATTFGGDDWDDTGDVAVDSADRPVIVGTTESRTFPTTAGALDRRCNDDDEVYSCTNHSDGFVTTLAADGSAIVWSTFLGGAGYDEAHAVAVDDRGDVFVTGSASSERAFPLREAFQADERGGEPCGPRAWCADAFLVRLSHEGGLVSGTLLGGASMDSGNGVAIDPEADAWVTGYTHSTDFPATADAAQPSIGGGNCSFYRDWYEYDECSDGFLSELDPAAPPDPPVSSNPAQDPGTSPSTGASSPVGGTTTSPSTGAGPTGTAYAARHVTLARSGTAFAGRVRADRGGRRCTGRIPLMLERRSGRVWRPVRRLLTRLDGRFKTALPARSGPYRVRAPRLQIDDLTCRAARSPTVRRGS